MRNRTASCAVLALTAALVAAPAPAQNPAQPTRWVVRDVRLGAAEDAPRHTLVLRHGRIEAVLDADAAVPHGARVVDGEGHIALPAFLDAHSEHGCETPTPAAQKDVPVSTQSDVRIDMREANRKGIQPTFRAAEALAFDGDASEPWRDQGFGAVLSVPSGQLLAGTSALATTREAAARDLVVRDGVYAHAAFDASGGGYPRTLMAFHSQLRQFFLDAQRHAELQRRHEQGRPGPRPPYDAELEAAGPLMNGEQRVVCEVRSYRDVERWIKLSDQFGFRIGVAGGRDTWRIADTLAARGLSVVLTLDWGDEVKEPEVEEVDEGDESDEDEAPTEEATDWKYEEPLGVRLERRREWEEIRDGALRLHEAGVRFVFGTADGKPKDLLENVRTLVELGLPAEVAMDALTTGAAEYLGVADRLGKVEAGYDATFALWTESPMDEEAQLAWLFVDGVAHEYEVKEKGGDAGDDGPAEGVDATGVWKAELQSDDEEGPGEARLELEMDEAGAVKGALTVENPMTGEDMTTSLVGEVRGDRLTTSGTFGLGDFDIEVSFEGTIEGDTLEGETTWKGPWGEDSSAVKATRQPDAAKEVQS